MGRVVEGARRDFDPLDYYMDYETKEEAIEEIKDELRDAFSEDNGESFDGHDDADYEIDEFVEALDEFDWDIPLDERDAEVE